MRLIIAIAFAGLTATSALAQSAPDGRPINPAGISGSAARPVAAGIGDLAGRPINPAGIGDLAGRPIDPAGISDPAGRPIDPAGIGQRSRFWVPGDVPIGDDPFGSRRDLAGRPIKPDGIGEPTGRPADPSGVAERSEDDKRGS